HSPKSPELPALATVYFPVRQRVGSSPTNLGLQRHRIRGFPRSGGGVMARPNILDRFRPVGAPGPAGPAGVPAADDQGPAVELAPVFDALAADVQACRTLVAEARRDAEAALSR